MKTLTKHIMMAVKPCTCTHPYQDTHYGHGMRIGNRVNAKEGNVYRCTVCAREMTL